MTEEEIHKICEKYHIRNYQINDDMSIDVDGDINLKWQGLTNLPLKFNKVTDDFDCSDNKLITLEGCPKYVGEDFYCNNNILTTLQHLPINFYIGGNFYCTSNNIFEAKEYGRLLFGTVVGYLTTGIADIGAFLNKNKNPPKKDLPILLSELRKIIV